MIEPAIGLIVMCAFDWAPKNWALCQGQLLSIAQNQALFSILGTTYGGNGQTTFGLPDLRGRTPMGIGQGPGLSNRTQGESIGTETVTLLASNLPAHTHTGTLTLATTSTAADTDEPGGQILAAALPNHFAAASNLNGTLGGLVAGSSGNTGGNQPLNIRQPYLVINFVICLFGIFPSRN